MTRVPLSCTVLPPEYKPVKDRPCIPQTGAEQMQKASEDRWGCDTGTGGSRDSMAELKGALSSSESISYDSHLGCITPAPGCIRVLPTRWGLCRVPQESVGHQPKQLNSAGGIHLAASAGTFILLWG